MTISHNTTNRRASQGPTASMTCVAVSCALLGLIASQVGCSQLSQRPSEHLSLGDWMRGNHRPLTPDESAFYSPPAVASVSTNLDASAVHLDGSVPPETNLSDRYAANQSSVDGSQRYAAFQFPGNYQVVSPGQPTANANNSAISSMPSQVTSPQPFQFSAPQGPPLPPGSTVDPNQRPAIGQTNNYAAPQPAAPQYSNNQYSGGPYSGNPSQFQGGVNQSFQNPGAQSQPNPYAGQNGGVQYTPNTTPFNAAPYNQGNMQPGFAPPGPFQTGPSAPTFVPGDGTNYPPQGYEPIYTPTLRDADLIINGFPARTGRIMFGGAVNSDAGVTGQITVDERNFDIRRWPTSFQQLFTGQAFRGAGETFRIEAAPGSDFDRYTVQWATPNLFNYLPFSFSVSGFLFDRRFNDWDEHRGGARTSLGYRITPDLSLSVGISGQRVDMTNPTSTLSPQLNRALGKSDLYTGSISLKHDTRNSPIQASEGHYFEATFEESFGDFDYSRFEMEFRQYWKLSERIDGSGKQTLSYSTKLGFSGDETPVYENFFAGGYATIRGFDFRGASPVENGVEVGGRFQWLNTLEYMFPITADDAFRGVAFVDFGTVESDIEINEDNFRVAPGVGVRVAIPALGPAPLAFDFAFPVAKADTDNERIFSFYMSLIR
ncbi:BamA/TamA family outer membrane protein [Stieleria marina]|uniref:Translocation and assembly module TamA n=1 Tax=Stieleria marina TaxID=1930275 RepID=A0A517NQM6_9BACT|nr:Translocation and assembly module TamA precursor [Planctomycetes bacterium K23_9]